MSQNPHPVVGTAVYVTAEIRLERTHCLDQERKIFLIVTKAVKRKSDGTTISEYSLAIEEGGVKALTVIRHDSKQLNLYTVGDLVRKSDIYDKGIVLTRLQADHLRLFQVELKIPE